MSTKTAMDKKIDELNAKAGKATGIDIKGSAIAISKEIYHNKPVFYSSVASTGLFVFTGLGFIACTVAGVATYFGTKKVQEKQIVEEVK